MKISELNGEFLFSCSPIIDNSSSLCEYCRKIRLSPTYVSIVEQLQKVGLLRDGYKKRCCFCYYVLNPENKVTIIRILNECQLIVGGRSKIEVTPHYIRGIGTYLFETFSYTKEHSWSIVTCEFEEIQTTLKYDEDLIFYDRRNE